MTGARIRTEYAIGGAVDAFWIRIAANDFWFAAVPMALVAKSRTVVTIALAANWIFIIYWLLR